MPHSIYTEVPEEGTVWPDSKGDGRGISSAGQVEREFDRGRVSDARLCAHDDINSLEKCGIEGSRVYQR